MQNLQKIKRCLISVSDKSGIVELAKFLSEKNVEIISTGGTYKLLKDSGLKVIEISEFTKFPEMMDGRLKTLHPKVHGGLLSVLDNENHVKSMQEHDIKSIDLLVVNLYPFVETVAKTNDEEVIIENIDIGGPAMVRSASKNFVYKTVITDVNQYENLIEEMNKNSSSTSFEFRKNLAIQAFKDIAKYDLAISNWFIDNNSLEESKSDSDSVGGQNNKLIFDPALKSKISTFPQGEGDKGFSDKSEFSLVGELKQSLRYGENSHQKASIYQTSNSGIVGAKQIQGKELSYNNLNDADAAYNLALEFEKPICAIIKHANPCGVALGKNHLEAFKKAFQADSKSAFGGIVAINGKIDEELAIEISKIFFEVIIAKEIDEKAKEVFEKKKNLRILIADFKKELQQQVKSVSGGFLVQDLDQKNITKNDLKLVSKISVNDKDLEQLVFAMNICKYVKSNAITVVNNFQTVGLGAGQTSRVDACEIACKKASEFFDGEAVINKSQDAFLASDAFFPFADNIEIASKFGIKAVIATGGSIRDDEVIEMANEKGIALYFVETRHFRH